MKASEETLEKMYKEYELEQIDETLCQLTDTLIKKFSELLEDFDKIKDSNALEKDLTDNDLLRKDLKSALGYVAPFVPFIGLLSGGLTVGKHVITKMASDIDTIEVPEQQE